MVHLDLDEKEKEVLAAVLERSLADLSYEIADTDRKAFRDELKAKRDVLGKVLDALRKGGGQGGA